METTIGPPGDGAGNVVDDELWEQLKNETEAMTRYVLGAGLNCPASILDALRQTLDGGRSNGARSKDVAKLARSHAQLARLVAPAKPATIALLDRERLDAQRRRLGRLKTVLGPVPLVRHLMLVALMSLIAFVGLATLTDVAGQTATTEAFDRPGWVAVGSALYLLSAAALGAAFASLFRLYQYISDSTYDQKYDASYWMLIVLGLIAGMVLAQLVAIRSVAGQEALSKPLLALLGGFSAAAVHRILTQVVAGVESIFRGDARDEVRTVETAAAAQAAAQATTLRTEVAAHVVDARDALAKDDKQAASDALKRLLDGLLPAANEIDRH